MTTVIRQLALNFVQKLYHSAEETESRRQARTGMHRAAEAGIQKLGML